MLHLPYYHCSDLRQSTSCNFPVGIPFRSITWYGWGGVPAFCFPNLEWPQEDIYLSCEEGFMCSIQVHIQSLMEQISGAFPGQENNAGRKAGAPPSCESKSNLSPCSTSEFPLGTVINCKSLWWSHDRSNG